MAAQTLPASHNHEPTPRDPRFILVGTLWWRKTNSYQENTANFATASLQSIVVRHSRATVSGPNAPQLCLQHNPFTVWDVGQPRGNRQIKGDMGLAAMGEIRNKKVLAAGCLVQGRGAIKRALVRP